MILNGNVKTAIANLRSARWRSLLTMLGVIIGISSVVTIVSLGEGLKHQIVGQINQLGSDVITVRSGKLTNQGDTGGINLLAFLNTSTLTQTDIEAISRLTSVSQVAPVDFVTSTVSSEQSELNNASVIGTSNDFAQITRQNLAYGDFFSAQDQSFAVIGPNVARSLYQERNPVGHSIIINGRSFIIHGVLQSSSGGLVSVGETDYNSAVLIPFAQAKALTNNQTNLLQILIKSRDNVDATVADVQRALLTTHNQHEDFTVLKQSELLHIVSKVVNTVTGFISGIAAISLIVGGVGIMDIMLVSISERTREIGIRKAVGATDGQILKQFLVEGLALSVGGGIIGIILSLLINLGLRLYTSWQPLISIPVLILAVLISIVVGVTFSVVPALKAARKDPIDALRSV